MNYTVYIYLLRNHSDQGFYIPKPRYDRLFSDVNPKFFQIQISEENCHANFVDFVSTPKSIDEFVFVDAGTTYEVTLNVKKFKHGIECFIDKERGLMIKVMYKPLANNLSENYVSEGYKEKTLEAMNIYSQILRDTIVSNEIDLTDMIGG